MAKRPWKRLERVTYSAEQILSLDREGPLSSDLIIKEECVYELLSFSTSSSNASLVHSSGMLVVSL